MHFFHRLLEKWREYDEEHAYSCDFCGKEIFNYPVERLCKDCENNLVKTGELYCDKCGRRTQALGVCLGCKNVVPSFTQGFSSFVYDTYAAVLVNRFKNGRRRLSGLLGERMAKRFLEISSISKEEELVLVPVPITEEKEKVRGYNQAYALSKTVERYLKAQGYLAETDTKILQKVKETSYQKDLNFSERLENASGAYHVHKRTACKNKTILLIDDIMTTGATGSECAARLLGAGASKVYFLVSAALPEQKAFTKTDAPL